MFRLFFFGSLGDANDCFGFSGHFFKWQFSAEATTKCYPNSYPDADTTGD